MSRRTDWQAGYKAGAREAHLTRNLIDATGMIRTGRIYLIGYPTGAIILLATGQPWWLAAVMITFAIIAVFPYRAAVKRRNKARADLRYQSRYTTTYHPRKGSSMSKLRKRIQVLEQRWEQPDETGDLK